MMILEESWTASILDTAKAFRCRDWTRMEARMKEAAH
jgi:hypothetical protein